jgi:uncharacterized protein
MKLTHLPVGDYVRQPWKNGGGTTAEVARDDEGGRWLWRLSVADVECSGPFSDFSGYRRSIAMIAGAGMRLTFDRAPPRVIDRPYVPHEFDGALRTDCALIAGPVRDVNLIADAARCAASLEFGEIAGALRFARELADRAVLLAVSGCIRVDIGTESIELAEGDALRIDDASGQQACCTAARSVVALASIAARW